MCSNEYRSFDDYSGLHAERDIVMAFPSVGLSVCLSSTGSDACQRMDISSNFIEHLDRGVILVFFEPHCHYKFPMGTLQWGH